MEGTRFHWADYLVFGLSLLLSSLIGVWFGCTGKKASTTKDFLLAGRDMNVLPVSMSLFVSWLSAISFLGDPVEVYSHGSVYVYLGIGYVTSLPFIAHFFAPKLNRLGLVSVYEFLETKYNKPIRILAAVLCIMITEAWLSIVLYAPALALSQASGIPVWVSIVCIGIVCTFYTTIGGMKAVLWADSVQMLIMVAGQLAVVIQGTIQTGGIANVWRIAGEGGRLNFKMFDPNPLLRASFWTFFVGGFFRVLNPYIGTQFLVQRFSTVKSPRHACLVAYWNVPMFILLVTLFWLIGLVMYALYHDCDPLLNHQIERRDQMIPLLVIDLLSFMPGIPGLFLACVFSASLSSLSSGFNGSAAVCLKDFVEPLYKFRRGVDLTDEAATKISKAFAVFFGALTIGLAFLIMEVGTSIFEMTAKITGMFGGPMASVFLCGFAIPRLQNASVMTGFVVSLFISLWWGIGGVFHKSAWVSLPYANDGCPNNGSLTNGTTAYIGLLNQTLQSTAPTLNVTAGPPDTGFQVSDLYQLSPLLYNPVTVAITVVVAVIVELITGCFGRIFNYNRYRNLYVIGGERSSWTFTSVEPDMRGISRNKNRSRKGRSSGRSSETSFFTKDSFL